MSEFSTEYGSLIVYYTQGYRGSEVIIANASGKTWHANVVSRDIDGQVIYAAIFPRLAEGRYTVRTVDAYKATSVSVFGGHEAEVDFR